MNTDAKMAIHVDLPGRICLAVVVDVCVVILGSSAVAYMIVFAHDLH